MKKAQRAKAPNNQKSLDKVFSDAELNEIKQKMPRENDPREAKAEVREKYRAIKRRVKEMEIGNQDRLIAFPSLISGTKRYKMIEFSALRWRD